MTQNPAPGEQDRADLTDVPGPPDTVRSRGMRSVFGLPNMKGRRGLVLAIVIDSLGSGLFLPVSAIYFVATKGYSVVVVGGFMSIAALAAAAAGPAAGALVDRLGARQMILISNGMRAVAFVGYLFADDVVLATILVALSAAGDNAFWPANSALVSQVADQGESTRWFALERVLRNVGLGLGAMSAGILVTSLGNTGYTILVVGNAVSFVLAGLALATSPIGSDRPHTGRDDKTVGYGVVLRDRQFMLLLTVNALFILCHLSFSVLLTLFIIQSLHAGPWLVGILFTGNTVAVTIVQLGVSRFIERRHPVAILRRAAGLWLVAFLMLALLPSVSISLRISGVCLAVGLLTMAEVLEVPTGLALMTVMASEDLIGRYLGLHQLSWSLAGIAAPITLLGLLAVDAALPWLALALGCGLAIIILSLLKQQLDNGASRFPSPPGLSE